MDVDDDSQQKVSSGRLPASVSRLQQRTSRGRWTVIHTSVFLAVSLVTVFFGTVVAHDAYTRPIGPVLSDFVLGVVLVAVGLLLAVAAVASLFGVVWAPVVSGVLGLGLALFSSFMAGVWVDQHDTSVPELVFVGLTATGVLLAWRTHIALRASSPHEDVERTADAPPPPDQMDDDGYDDDAVASKQAFPVLQLLEQFPAWVPGTDQSRIVVVHSVFFLVWGFSLAFVGLPNILAETMAFLHPAGLAELADVVQGVGYLSAGIAAIIGAVAALEGSVKGPKLTAAGSVVAIVAAVWVLVLLSARTASADRASSVIPWTLFGLALAYLAWRSLRTAAD